MEKFAVPISEAASIAGIAESNLRRAFIKPGLVTPIDLGGRGPVILVSELHAAIEKKAAEQRADPSKRKLRSAGAHLAAKGIVANPWGRAGKPKGKTPKR